jgi:predicted nucleic acid-binding protein
VTPDASQIFVDTAYVSALINARDQWHQPAISWQRQLAAQDRRLVTTEFILVEIADGLATVRFRRHAARVIDVLRKSPSVDVIPASPQLFSAALDLYQNRPDKDWSLTDCTSFVVMAESGLTQALTTDGHFRQAGFQPLLTDVTQ